MKRALRRAAARLLLAHPSFAQPAGPSAARPPRRGRSANAAVLEALPSRLRSTRGGLHREARDAHHPQRHLRHLEEPVLHHGKPFANPTSYGSKLEGKLALLDTFRFWFDIVTP
jgi:hypothetical protein